MIGRGKHDGRRRKRKLKIIIELDGTSWADVPNVRRSARSRVDHFGRGLQVVVATADRCNTSATNRVVQHRRRWRTVTTAGISTSLSLPVSIHNSSTFSSHLTPILPASFFFLPLFFSRTVYRVRTNWQYHPSRSTPPLSSTLPPFLSATISLRLFPALQDPHNDVLRTY